MRRRRLSSHSAIACSTFVLSRHGMARMAPGTHSTVLPKERPGSADQITALGHAGRDPDLASLKVMSGGPSSALVRRPPRPPLRVTRDLIILTIRRRTGVCALCSSPSVLRSCDGSDEPESEVCARPASIDWREATRALPRLVLNSSDHELGPACNSCPVSARRTFT